MKKILIVDYGYGNLFSLAKALVYIGAIPQISQDPRDLDSARAVIVPGVGAFGDGMAELEKRGFKKALLDLVCADKPLLGICLGMQFLFQKSYEFGEHSGLGIIEGTVQKIQVRTKGFCKIPHVGWNSLQMTDKSADWRGTLLEGITPGQEMYFVHSFVGYPEKKGVVLANTHYCGSTIPAVVVKGSVLGVQFHPEKSGETGILILKNFLSFV